MRSSIGLALAITAALAAPAGAAEPIEGTWRVPEGGLVEIAPCGDAYCLLVKTGPFKGRSTGRLSGAGEGYKGTVTDPRDQKSYDGTATVKGTVLTLTGCALKIFCKTQTWTRT